MNRDEDSGTSTGGGSGGSYSWLRRTAKGKMAWRVAMGMTVM